MYDVSLTPAAEAAYAARAAAFGETIEEYLNETLLAQLPDGGYMNEKGEYVPTAEERKLIQEGLDDLEAGRFYTHEEVWSNIWQEFDKRA